MYMYLYTTPQPVLPPPRTHTHTPHTEDWFSRDDSQNDYATFCPISTCKSFIYVFLSDINVLIINECEATQLSRFWDIILGQVLSKQI